MGMGRVAVEAIIREHQYKPITGDVLMIGRQTVYFTPDELLLLLSENGLPTTSLRPETIEIDRSTIDRRGGTTKDFITDRSLFRALSQSTQSPPPVVKALDVSSYEGAEIIHDLNEPVPERLRSIADFVVDGSTLDNTFNAAQTLVNYCEMLRPGGRLLAVNAFSPHDTPYAILPPQTFLDYFIVNGFVDCKVYILAYDQSRLNVLHLDLRTLERERRTMGRLVAPHHMATLVLAEKGPSSTTRKTPIQQDYRSESQWSEYLANLALMIRSPRPHLARSTATLFFQPPSGNILVDGEFQSAWH